MVQPDLRDPLHPRGCNLLEPSKRKQNRRRTHQTRLQFNYGHDTPPLALLLDAIQNTMAKNPRNYEESLDVLWTHGGSRSLHDLRLQELSGHYLSLRARGGKRVHWAVLLMAGQLVDTEGGGERSYYW